MPATNTLTYLFYLGFILIPGYVTLRGYLAGNVKLDDLPRTDKILVMVLSGIVVLFISVAIHRLNFPEVTNWILQSIIAGSLVEWDVVFRSKVLLTPPNDLSVLYATFILFSQSVLGWPLGWFVGRRIAKSNGDIQSFQVLNQPWEEVVTHAARGDSVTVVTTQNREISGEVEQLGSPSESYDILLAEPKELLREENGDIHTERELGAHSYHHYRDISHIEFEDEFDKEQPPPWTHAPVKTTRERAKQWFYDWRTTQQTRLQRLEYSIFPKRSSSEIRKRELEEADAVVSLSDGRIVLVEMKGDEEQAFVKPDEHGKEGGEEEDQ